MICEALRPEELSQDYQAHMKHKLLHSQEALIPSGPFVAPGSDFYADGLRQKRYRSPCGALNSCSAACR